MNTNNTRGALIASALAFTAFHASAVGIVGGSDLLTLTRAQQLETWLNQGDVSLTNIFDKANGQTAADFHSAVDGKGSTFTVIEVLGKGSTNFAQPMLIGGYNPSSWSNGGWYTQTQDNEDRTAFVFNLSTNTVHHQRLNVWEGNYQTYNENTYGPTFGGGHDLYVDNSLFSGYSYLWSYGLGNGTDLTGGSWSGQYFRYGQMEVFAVGAPVAAIPEPETYALMLAGLGAMGMLTRRRLRR